MSTKIYVSKSHIEGRGIFATGPVRPSEIIGLIKGPVMKKVNSSLKDSLGTPDWVGFKENTWIDPEPPFKFINHSCNPNCGIKGTKTVVALRPIKKDEEYTLDYSITEIDPNWHLQPGCFCGEKN